MMAEADRDTVELAPVGLEASDADAAGTATAAVPPRERWDSRSSFILAAVGAAIGLGNVWRFSVRRAASPAEMWPETVRFRPPRGWRKPPAPAPAPAPAPRAPR